MSSVQTNENIREYWNARARERDLTNTATTDDVYLRELEIETFVAAISSLKLSPASLIVDVGCGDGYSTLGIAGHLSQFRYIGVDYSDEMIELAKTRLANTRLAQHAGSVDLSFQCGDVLRLTNEFGDGSIDVVLTDRCLINLESAESQADAVRQIAGCIKPGGYLVSIENFLEGQQALTAARRRVDLPEIPVRWHNRFFSEPEFESMTRPFFDSLEYRNFSSTYYLVTRVVYSAMCKENGAQPDYRHPIHRIATSLPPLGNFSPIRMAILRRNSHSSGSR